MDITRSLGGLQYLLKIDIADCLSISFPLFKSSSGYGSLIIDSNNVVIWEHSETINTTGTSNTIIVPEGAMYLILGISPSLNNLDFSVVLTNTVDKILIDQLYANIEEVKNSSPTISMKNENRNLCLGAIKTDILNNKIPYQRGYLFHKLANDDKSLWYGNDFNNVMKVGTVSFYPKDYMLAVSPRDGRVIAVNRTSRSTMYIWDGKDTTELFGVESEIRPRGWLYNSGVEFTKDTNGVEYCLFAEYSGSDVFNVWKGKYPYISESDWEIVFSQFYHGQGEPTESISHFHQVRRDPWTNILYLTSGDSNTSSKWWYSLDDGTSWTLLTTGDTSGFEEHTCRCINFVFTKDYIYWATDHGINHTLNRISRNIDTGIIDISTRFKLADLPYAQATNSLCYVDNPKGLFMFERIDIGFDTYYDKGIDVLFWSFDNNDLQTVMHINFVSPNWGGHRGKCYTNYTNGYENRPAMGFSSDSPCIFDVVSPNPSDIGTVCYEINNGVIKFITY